MRTPARSGATNLNRKPPTLLSNPLCPSVELYTALHESRRDEIAIAVPSRVRPRVAEAWSPTGNSRTERIRTTKDAFRHGVET